MANNAEELHKLTEWGTGPYISSINVAGSTYHIKDAEARAKIELLHTTGAMHFVGVALNAIPDSSDPSIEVTYVPVYVKNSDGAVICYYFGTQPSDNPVIIDGDTYDVAEYIELESGDVFISGDSEWVFSEYDELLHRLGTTGSFKAFAYADKGTATVTHAGTVTVELNPTKETPTVNVNQGSVSASGKFTPAGTVSIAAGSTESVVNSVTTDKKYLAYSEIATGVTPTTTTLKTSNIHTDISKTQKVLETKSVRQAGADVSVPNVTANTEVKIPNVTGNTTVTATHVTKKGETASVAAIGDSITAVNSITAPSSVVTGVSDNKVSVLSSVTPVDQTITVNSETLIIPSAAYLSDVTTGSSQVVGSTTASTDSISHGSVTFNAASKTAVEIDQYELEDIQASKVTLGTQLTATNTTLGTALTVAGAGSEVTLASGKIADSDTSGATIVTDVSTTGEMAVVTGLTSGTSVVTGVSTASKTSVVTGLAESGEEADEVVTTVQSGSTTVMKSVGAATFTGTEGTVSVSGSTSGVSASINKAVVTDVTVSKATFAGTTETIEVNPVV